MKKQIVVLIMTLICITANAGSDHLSLGTSTGTYEKKLTRHSGYCSITFEKIEKGSYYAKTNISGNDSFYVTKGYNTNILRSTSESKKYEIKILIALGSYIKKPVRKYVLKNLETKKSYTCNINNKLVPFRTDGCSASPDSLKLELELSNLDLDKANWVTCCIIHDIAYYRGGVKHMRKLADNNLQTCVEKIGEGKSDFTKALLKSYSKAMLHAVTGGGHPLSIWPWRWGYGWKNHELGYVKLSKERNNLVDSYLKGLDPSTIALNTNYIPPKSNIEDTEESIEEDVVETIVERPADDPVRPLTSEQMGTLLYLIYGGRIN